MSEVILYGLASYGLYRLFRGILPNGGGGGYFEVLRTDKTTYTQGETIHWEAQNLIYGSKYRIRLNEIRIHEWIATTTSQFGSFYITNEIGPGLARLVLEREETRGNWMKAAHVDLTITLPSEESNGYSDRIPNPFGSSFLLMILIGVIAFFLLRKR